DQDLGSAGFVEARRLHGMNLLKLEGSNAAPQGTLITTLPVRSPFSRWRKADDGSSKPNTRPHPAPQSLGGSVWPLPGTAASASFCSLTVASAQVWSRSAYCLHHGRTPFALDGQDGRHRSNVGLRRRRRDRMNVIGLRGFAHEKIVDQPLRA